MMPKKQQRDTVLALSAFHALLKHVLNDACM